MSGRDHLFLGVLCSCQTKDGEAQRKRVEQNQLLLCRREAKHVKLPRIGALHQPWTELDGTRGLGWFGGKAGEGGAGVGGVLQVDNI